MCVLGWVRCSTCGVKQGLDAEVMGEANRSKLLHKLRGRLCQAHQSMCVCLKEYTHMLTHCKQTCDDIHNLLFLLPAGSRGQA